MQQHGNKYFARRHAPTQGELRGLEKWDLCFVIYKFSKITLCRDINLTYLPCLTSVWQGNTSFSWNSCVNNWYLFLFHV